MTTINEYIIRLDFLSGSQEIDILHRDADLTKIDYMGNSLLHLAFENEEPNQNRVIEILEFLLDRGLDINVTNLAGKTILHLAIQHRYKDVIDFCIRGNADLHVTNFIGNTCAHFVIEEEYRRLHQIDVNQNLEKLKIEGSNFVDWMISRGIDFFHKKNKINESAIYLAVKFNLQHILLALLKHITDLSTIKKNQSSLLCYFLQKKVSSQVPIDSLNYDYNIVKMILEKNQSMSNKTLITALCIATNNNESKELIDLLVEHAINIQQEQKYADSLIQTFTKQYHKLVRFRKKIEHVKILKILIDIGANINESYGNNGTIAMMWFRYHPKLEMLQQLKKFGADFSVHMKNGTGFLHLAATHNKEPEIIELLVKEGCNVNGIDGDGYSPLSLACINERTKIAITLIRFGADLKYKNRSGWCLLHLAVNCPNTLALLVKKGADVNARDNEGQTPLHYAHGSRVIENLFNIGGFIDLHDNEGNTPLFCAMSRKRPTIIEELLKYGADIREPKVFQRAIAHFRFADSMKKETFRYLMEHLVKLMAVGLLKEIHHSHWSSDNKLQVFFKMCLAEVESLKDFFVDNYTSLYQLLHRNRNRRCAYVNNEKLKSLVGDDVILEKFPIYFVMIIGCYNEARTRKHLLKEATLVLKNIIRVSLPYLCVDQIFIDLSNIDLMRIIEASKNL